MSITTKINNLSDPTRYTLALVGFIAVSFITNKMLSVQKQMLAESMGNSFEAQLENYQDKHQKLIIINGTMCYATHGKNWEDFRNKFKNDYEKYNDKFYIRLEKLGKHSPGLEILIASNIILISKFILISSILLNKSPLTEGPYPKIVSNYKTYFCLFVYCSLTYLENQIVKTDEFKLFANNNLIWDYKDDEGLPEDLDQLIDRVAQISKL